MVLPTTEVLPKMGAILHEFDGRVEVAKMGGLGPNVQVQWRWMWRGGGGVGGSPGQSLGEGDDDVLAPVILEQAMVVQGLNDVVALDCCEVRQVLDAHLVTRLLLHQNLRSILGSAPLTQHPWLSTLPKPWLQHP